MAETKKVVVNFNVNVDASGNVEVFGQGLPDAPNPVVCAVNLPVADLYGSDANAVFEFQEPASALGTRVARRTQAGWTKAEDLRADLNSIINGTMDASGAIPFNDAKYASTEEYYKHETFGRLALSMYAHYLFGHVAATAAITNDQPFMDNMNGNTEGTALLGKGLKDAVVNMSDADVLAIVEQVLGQDASRAKDQDNNEVAPDVWQALKFYADDVVYVQITV